MKDFMGEHFLLESEPANILYRDFAREMPIFDFHNHLSARDICEKRRFKNLAELWLETDHYKWRAMRVLGVDEKYITGDATDFEKFNTWVAAMERLPGTPLYHWCHMELAINFNISVPLTIKNCREVWDYCNTKLQEPGYDALAFIKKRNVRTLCTTDEPSDSLEWHYKIKEVNYGVEVLPSFRPDKLIEITGEKFTEAVSSLGKRFGVTVTTIDDLKKALRLAIKYFKEAGCLTADHGFTNFDYSRRAFSDNIFQKALSGHSKELSHEEAAAYKGEILHFLGSEYYENEIVMQLHIGGLRNNNTLLFRTVGSDSGGDSAANTTDPALLAAFLDDLYKENHLPNTVLYCLNTGDNATYPSLCSSFARPPVKGKVQFGSAWWFADHLKGIEEYLDVLIAHGLLSTSIGMLTDSRSVTGFVRHGYFRRILCNKLGKLIEKGEYPEDYEAMGRIVEDVCYNNAVNFFKGEHIFKR